MKNKTLMFDIREVIPKEKTGNRYNTVKSHTIVLEKEYHNCWSVFLDGKKLPRTIEGNATTAPMIAIANAGFEKVSKIRKIN